MHGNAPHPRRSCFTHSTRRRASQALRKMCNIKLAAALGEWQRYIAKLLAIEEEKAQREARIRQIMTSATARIVNAKVRLSSVSLLAPRCNISPSLPAQLFVGFGLWRRETVALHEAEANDESTQRPCVTSSTAQSGG